jgi:LacI family transcriptional regulator
MPRNDFGSTIRDVAREAGVSVATVSRVLNDSGPVRAETRRRIDEVAHRLQFTPNPTARSLSMRCTHTIGVLLPDLYGEFFSEVIRGIDQTVQQNGYHVLISSSHNSPREVERALSAMRGRLDGLILMVPDLELETVEPYLPRRIPVVLLNADLKQTAYNSLNIDNVGGARAITMHLLERGHRSIGMIQGPELNRDARDRARGFAEAMHARGLAGDSALLMRGDFTEASGHRATRTLLDSGRAVTAIFAANDSMAVGALSALREAGRHVPDEVAVVGFDDIPIAQYLNPPLTTVRVSIARLGARAAERMFECVRATNPPDPKQEVLPAELVIRRSCGAGVTHQTLKEAVP